MSASPNKAAPPNPFGLSMSKATRHVSVILN